MSAPRFVVPCRAARLSLQCQILSFFWISCLTSAGTCASVSDKAKAVTYRKQVIGPTAVVKESESDFKFPARVDTGATTSSLHVEDWQIENEAPVMAKNVGKTIRFCIKNQRGELEWLERKIAEISVIKTSEQEEQRYKVRLTLNCLDVKKRVLVSLNDRSHMTYPVLLGRNFLEDHFLVDVALGKGRPKTSGVKTSRTPTEAGPQLQAKVNKKPRK